mmetsp:Transcript_87539/g.250798  ORF Transcript_87539/g.250798 Transcript_87539/m.250798 type:complete len:227 (-) Transcript_87539:328-1008(-)
MVPPGGMYKPVPNHSSSCSFAGCTSCDDTETSTASNVGISPSGNCCKSTPVTRTCWHEEECSQNILACSRPKASSAFTGNLGATPASTGPNTASLSRVSLTASPTSMSACSVRSLRAAGEIGLAWTGSGGSDSRTSTSCWTQPISMNTAISIGVAPRFAHHRPTDDNADGCSNSRASECSVPHAAHHPTLSVTDVASATSALPSAMVTLYGSSPHGPKSLSRLMPM